VSSGVLLRLERIGRRARRPLDVARAALLSTREKDDDRRRLYARRVVQRFTSLDENLNAGLTPIEESLLSRHPLGGDKVLVLGCGPGREAVGLAERGCKVTGLDREEGMLADARNFAARRGVDVRFVVGDAFEFQVDGAPFDAVVIFSGLVNMILPSARRVRTLACSFEHLGPGGRVLVTFLSAYRGQGAAPPPASPGFWRAVNPEHEPGDHYLLNETVHVYRCAAELCAESAEAGFEVEAVHRDQRAYDKADGLVRGYAVLRKPR
jgi:SAM-dependent methyltransferase